MWTVLPRGKASSGYTWEAPNTNKLFLVDYEQGGFCLRLHTARQMPALAPGPDIGPLGMPGLREGTRSLLQGGFPLWPQSIVSMALVPPGLPACHEASTSGAVVQALPVLTSCLLGPAQHMLYWFSEPH